MRGDIGQALQVKSPGTRQSVSVALTDYVQRVTTAHSADLAAVILYGSQARGDAADQSDIDLLILIRRDSPALRQALASIAWDVQFEHNLIISDIIRKLDQWAHMQEMQFPLRAGGNGRKRDYGAWAPPRCLIRCESHTDAVSQAVRFRRT